MCGTVRGIYSRSRHLATGLLFVGIIAGQAPADASAVESPSPVALKRVAVNQHLRKAAVTFSGRHALPRVEDLKLYPGATRSAARHLCLVAQGSAIAPTLLCLGGRRIGDRARLGISRLHAGGRATKVRGIEAEFARPRPSTIKLEFGLRGAGFHKGRFRFFGVSGWHGPACPKTTRDCADRWPESGAKKGRIRPVIRTGCSIGDVGAFRNGPRRGDRVALTFDDGPSSYTRSVMRILDRHHAKGTFFQVGQEIPGSESTLRRLIAHGHEIGNHSLRHEPYPSSGSMRATSDLIERATGFRPCTFRPPGGAYTSGTVAAARSIGMSVALWDRDTNDWRLPGESAIKATAVSAQAGSIVLMHDGGGPRTQTVEALPDIISKLQRRGFRLVTVTKLLGGHYKLAERGK